MRIARIATLAAACLVGGVAAGLVAAAPDRTAAGQLVGTVGPG
ncbi:MAG: hypothetical protein QOH95_861, partial [Gaiellaceae bacterium]|nr:hypothetical protein [Gaiellaceae bacterium]